jgi:hypothetical protein
MQQHSNPIDFLIEFAWANGADRFVVNNGGDACGIRLIGVRIIGDL